MAMEMIYAKLLTDLHNMEAFIEGYCTHNTPGTDLTTQNVVIKYTVTHQPLYLEMDTHDIVRHFEARAKSLRQELVNAGVLKK